MWDEKILLSLISAFLWCYKRLICCQTFIKLSNICHERKFMFFFAYKDVFCIDVFPFSLYVVIWVSKQKKK